MELMVIILVTLIMVSFVGFAIFKIKQQLEVQINKDVDRLSTYYDEILNVKTEELEEKKKALQKLNEECVVSVEDTTCSESATKVIMNENKYVNSSFFKDYNKVKNTFSDVALTHAIEKVLQLIDEEKHTQVSTYKELLSKLDFNIQYNLQSLSVADQLDILQSILGTNVQQNEVLNQYIELNDNFDLSNFITYLNDYIFFNDTQIIVASNQGLAFSDEKINGVRYVKDDTIGEGYQIRYKNKMYDYSISLGGNNE